MPDPQVDYASLAKQFGAVSSAPAGGSDPIDYEGLAKQYGGVSEGAGSLYDPNRHVPSAEDYLPQQSSGWPAKIGDVLIGAAKGLGSTVTHLGELAQDAGMIPGMVPAGFNPAFRSPVLQRAEQVTTPTNTAQHIGKIGEQIAEVVLPTKAASAVTAGMPLVARMGAEGAVNAGMAMAQGGNPVVAGTLGAVLPGAGALIQKAAPALREAAETQVVQALGPTKERFKAMAERLSPEILRRGLRGSREQLQAQAEEAASTAGDKIDSAIQQFGGREIDTSNVVDALESAKNAFRTSTRQPLDMVRPDLRKNVMSVGPDGMAVVAHEFEPRAIQQLSGLQQIMQELGPTARADQLIAIRRAWDKVVDQAGGYSHRAGGAIGVPLSDQSEAWAKRAATSAIREQLNASVPELTDLNKEFSFWKGMNDVLTQTLRRTQPQGPGLLGAAAEATGNVVGGVAGMSHGPAGAATGAFALGKLGKMAQLAFSSPRWKLVSAQTKDKLANAIANNDVSSMATILARVGSVEGSKIGQ